MRGLAPIALVPALAAGLLAGTAPALEVTHVDASRHQFDPAAGESVAVHFRVSDPARVQVRIWDGRDWLIRELASDALLPAGDHESAWDGRDQAGRLVPPEAYHYTVTATDAKGTEVEHDLTDLTGGEDTDARDLRWDRDAGVVRYVLSQPARVSLRLGITNGGPFLLTLLDWVPRSAGPHAEHWNGRDASDVIDLGSHPSLGMLARAFTLPDNTILVLPEPDSVQLVKDVSWKVVHRTPTRTPRKRMAEPAQQPIEVRRDVLLHLMLPDDLPRDDAGLPVLRGAVPVRVDVPDADRARMLAERFEVSFFLDGQFVFENEVGFLPATWVFDAGSTSPGVHYLTSNLRGYEAHFGVATLRIRVEPGERAE